MHSESEISFDSDETSNPIDGEKSEEERKEEREISVHPLGEDTTKLVSEVSLDQIEKDLLDMINEGERGEMVLGEEKHKELFSEACLQVTRFCRRYLREDDIRKVFPGVVTHNLEESDFSTAPIKIFVLSTKEFEDFDNKYKLKDDTGIPSSASAQIFIGSRKTTGGTDENGMLRVEKDKSPNILVVLREIQEIGVDFSSFDGGRAENLSDLELDLRNTMRHELLHTLKVGVGFPRRVTEGIVALYARLTRDKNEPYRENTSYISEVRVVLGVASLARQEGLDVSLVDRVLFGVASREEDRQFIGKVREKLGEDFADKFFIKGFEDREDTRKAARLVWDCVK